MGNIRHYFRNCSIFTTLTICAFTSSIITKPIYAQINDPASMSRIRNLMQSSENHAKSKNFTGLIDDVFKLKQEVELIHKKRLDVDDYVKAILTRAKENTRTKLNPKIEKAVSDIIKNHGKGFDLKIRLHNDCSLSDYEMTELETYFLYQKFNFDHFLEKPKDKHGNEIKEIVVPVSILIGVTCFFAGTLIGIVPIQVPYKTETVTFLVTTGLGYIIQGIKEAADDQKKIEKH